MTSARYSRSPPRRRNLSLSETMFAAPSAAAATNHLDRRGRSLRAAAATRAASSAVAAMSPVQPVVHNAARGNRGRRTGGSNTVLVGAMGARAAATAPITTSAEEGSRASSLTRPACRATAPAGSAARTPSPVPGTTRASGRGCPRHGLPVSSHCSLAPNWPLPYPILSLPR